MARLTITEAEILSELDGALAVTSGPKGAKTTKEIMASKGWGNNKTLRALAALGRQGRLVVHQVQRISDVDKRPQWVTAYTVLPAKGVSRAR